MALTAQEIVEVAHYTGYPAAGVIPVDVATPLSSLTAEGEARIRTRFLPALVAMEAGLMASINGMDTAKAAVWERNPNELRERAAAFYWQRVSLARFLEVDPGPACSLTDLPPFSTCCPKTSTGGGTTTPPIDPATGTYYTPAVYVVGLAMMLMPLRLIFSYS